MSDNNCISWVKTKCCVTLVFRSDLTQWDYTKRIFSKINYSFEIFEISNEFNAKLFKECHRHTISRTLLDHCL